ncbi:hypothetical protein LSH36_102g05040 [Paralvinella palmiformis]|uniref:Zinc finger homeobox protein 4 n=1 Tax=Paralvinella palmiformis TaxID=53620 RepID=A0AAD9N9U3_9ANNE|nr:hypothetical protein LSH36_102g05040 [Paralvinella palmiformis]
MNLGVTWALIYLQSSIVRPPYGSANLDGDQAADLPPASDPDYPDSHAESGHPDTEHGKEEKTSTVTVTTSTTTGSINLRTKSRLSASSPFGFRFVDVKGGSVNKISCPFCNFVTSSEMQIQLHVQTQHMGLRAPSMPQGGSTESAMIFRCPLCQEKCANQALLEKHLFQVHNVSPEGMHRLLSLVFNGDQPESRSPQKGYSMTPNKTKDISTITSQQTPKSDSQSQSEEAETNSQDPSPSKPSQAMVPCDGTTDPIELQSEMLESQALKLAEEATMEGVLLSDKDTDDHYRCQTCTKTFPNIDALYAHQNELGHLELKQTPRGPGYLCWKKGCNQYFKTAEALQMHFREIHARTPIVSTSERHIYKFRCTQCTLAFKALDKLQMHSYYHIIRAATKCIVCGRGLQSIVAMRKHVESTHMESMSPAEVEQYKASLASIAQLGLLGIPLVDPMMFGAMAAGQVPPLIQLGTPMPVTMFTPDHSSKDPEGVMDTDQPQEKSAERCLSESGKSATPEKHSMKQENLDSSMEGFKTEPNLPMDEDNISQVDDQFIEDYINSQAIAENSYSDPTRKFKCHRCKVAFTRQNYLSAHNKTLMHRKGDKSNCTLEKYMDPNRPYKCEVCRESFTQKNILLVHYNSVSHLHKLKQQQQQHHHQQQQLNQGTIADDVQPSEIRTATSDSCTNTHAERPPSAVTTTGGCHDELNSAYDETKPYKCHICKVAYSQSAAMDSHLRSGLHETRASRLQELAYAGQVDLSQPLIDQPDSSSQKVQQTSVEQQTKGIQHTTVHQLRSEAAMETSLPNPMMSAPILVPATSTSGSSPSASSPAISNPSPRPAISSGTSTPVKSVSPAEMAKVKTEVQTPQAQINSLTCTKCNAMFFSHEQLSQHQQLLCYSQQHLLRGMSRFKPQIQKSLLENIGFECVMQFNEYQQKVQNPVSAPNTERNPDDSKDHSPALSIKKDIEEVNAESVDLPEINKCQCTTCKKEFSSIWVLKAHQEEVHQQLIPIEYVEEFSIHFKDQYEKKHQTGNPSTNAETSTHPETAAESSTPSEPPMSQPHNFIDEKTLMGLQSADMAVAMQMMQMPMLMNGMLPMPMHMSMNIMPPLMPMMMPMGPTPEMFTGMPPLPLIDSNMMMVQQQQQAAALAAQQQKRARTRINDEQLKILRAYFDINNSPAEEQIMEMAEKSGLPPKVIKHWFRNTLFKERQRNKDSPYNFSVPPSTSLNLEEYEKTGKLPEQNSENEQSEGSVEKDYRQQHEGKDKDEKKCESNDTASQHKENSGQDVSQTKPKPNDIEGPKLNMQVQSSGKENGAQPLATSENKNKISLPTSTTVSMPTLSAASLPIPPMLPHPGMAGLAAPGMSFAEFSAALQGVPLGPAVTTSSGGNSAPSTPHHSTSSTPPRSLPSISPSHHSSGPGKRANRTRFTDYQIKVLQEYFDQNAYPKDDDLEHLSRLLNLSPRVIVVWFQNARQKARKNYENQPPLDMSDDGSKFTRTPGLNYQCKKCFTVFQRYYELIKHQRTHCYKDEKKLPFSFSQMMSQSSTSYGDSSNSDDSFKTSENEHSPRATSTPKSISTTPTPSVRNAPNKGIEYKCEKCNLVLPRLELWQEHQNIHNMNPSLFSPFSNNAFAMLQNVAQQEPLVARPSSTSNPETSPTSQHEGSSQNKHKYDDDDLYDRDGQPRDKRMRTTILPEQLDFLYQKYQVDCNPSRKQLENIAAEVGLKKRVVQVWFQNTRARERKGQFRAHQQIIHKRCPFCRALFRAKSALESHLATKHPEEMAKGDINIDAIPDEIPDGAPQSSQPQSPSMSQTVPGLDMAKLLNNPYNMPGPMMPLVPPVTTSASQDQVQSNMKKLYEDSLKHYLDELSHASHQPRSSASYSPDRQNKLDSFGADVKTENEDAPLDLSKPHGADKFGLSAEAVGQRKNVEDTKWDMHSEMSEKEDFIYTEDSNPPSPTSSTSSNQIYKKDSLNSSFPQKRFRTQMSSTQIRVMKKLFESYKTPTMAECELVGREIGLPKRVIQVWFQNARAKEKKAKLNYAKTFGGGSQMPDLDFQRPPDQCDLCNFRYSHKYTVQDHIFTKRHIDNVKQAVQNEVDTEHCVTNTPDGKCGKEVPDSCSGTPASWPSTSDPSSVTSHPHLAQLHAMGLQALSSQGSAANKDSPGSSKVKVKQEPKDADTKENKKSIPTTSAPAMNPFTGLPGLPVPPGGDLGPAAAAAAGLLPFLYPGLGGFYPGMPMMPGVMPGPESMMMYDPATFGTPLTLLQIPQQAIHEVQAKVQDPGCTLTRYTQDCRTSSSLKKELGPSEGSLVQSAYLDVGYICKKCHMVYPGKEACVHHQMAVCYPGKSANDAAILKLEQLQYKCSACEEKFSLISDYKAHCKTNSHGKAARQYLDSSTTSVHVHDSRPSSRSSAATPPCSRTTTTTTHSPDGACTDQSSSKSENANSDVKDI